MHISQHVNVNIFNFLLSSAGHFLKLFEEIFIPTERSDLFSSLTTCHLETFFLFIFVGGKQMEEIDRSEVLKRVWGDPLDFLSISRAGMSMKIADRMEY